MNLQVKQFYFIVKLRTVKTINPKVKDSQAAFFYQ